MTIQDALAILAPNILAHLDVYGVGRPNQSPVLPQALWTSKAELEALRVVIDHAKLPPPTNTEGCYGVTHTLRARVTKSGVRDRMPQGVTTGDVFPIKSLTPGAGPGYWNAHVTDAEGNIWTLGQGDWTPVGGLEPR